MSNEAWQAIENLPSTQWLSLNARTLSDEELRHLRGLRRLTELKMEAVPIDGSKLEYLASLPNLQTLSRIHLKDEHAHWLTNIKQLRVLGLNDSTISPSVAADLQQKMPWCQQYYEPWPPAASDSVIRFTPLGISETDVSPAADQ